ncbi:MAG: hypothetical protein ACR2QF_12230 [Geminicoccaceae bacterium]
MSDHYQTDDFREVNHFSRQNIFVAAFLIAILVIVVADILSSPKPHGIEVRQEAAIPWSPHPSNSRR